jgi:hypothetical protein
MKRPILGILFAILWAGVFYALAYPLIFVAVASWAGAREPDKYPTVCDEAFGIAMRTLNPYLIAGVLALGAFGAWARVLPGTINKSLIQLDSIPPAQRGFDRLPLQITVGSAATFFILISITHVTRTDFDMMSRFISEYAVNSVLGTLTLATGGVIFLSLAIGLARSVTPSFWLLLVSACLITASVALCVCTVCPTDLYGPDFTPPSAWTSARVLHNTFAALLAFSAVEAFLFLPGAFCRCPRWRPIFVQSMIAAALLVTVFLSASWLPFKLTPLVVKVLYVMMALWSFWIARRGLTMPGRSDSHRVMVQST